MSVLKAKETMVAMDTPLERVRVSKISAGMIQDRGPQVAEKEKLYSQVLVLLGICEEA
jgi:hypothetical protein